MDRDDAEMSDRSDEARQGDTGMIGSEAEEPGPGRDTSLTESDEGTGSTNQPMGTVAMSEGDPMATRLGSHVEGAGTIGYDVAAAEEGATQQTPPEDRPAYQPEDPNGAVDAVPADDVAAGYEGEPGAEEGVFDQEADQAGGRPADDL
jgi:hypothetical protein